MPTLADYVILQLEQRFLAKVEGVKEKAKLIREKRKEADQLKEELAEDLVHLRGEFGDDLMQPYLEEVADVFASRDISPETLSKREMPVDVTPEVSAAPRVSVEVRRETFEVPTLAEDVEEPQGEQMVDYPTFAPHVAEAIRTLKIGTVFTRDTIEDILKERLGWVDGVHYRIQWFGPVINQLIDPRGVRLMKGQKAASKRCGFQRMNQYKVVGPVRFRRVKSARFRKETEVGHIWSERPRRRRSRKVQEIQEPQRVPRTTKGGFKRGEFTERVRVSVPFGFDSRTKTSKIVQKMIQRGFPMEAIESGNAYNALTRLVDQGKVMSKVEDGERVFWRQ